MADERTTDNVSRSPGDKADDFQPVVFAQPELRHGVGMWRVARDSRKLDLNSSYAYLLWARDFAATSVVALVDAEVVGFVMGYLRPDEPNVVLVWQIAVDASQRGRGLAGQLLDDLLHRLGPRVTALETTVTPDNEASIALFKSLADRHSATMGQTRFLAADDFPDEHEAEELYRIEPLHVNS